LFKIAYLIFLLKRDIYNSLVRPKDEHGLTEVFTELKLLQIDIDEKYQELSNYTYIKLKE
jgi:hypothetical protein